MPTMSDHQVCRAIETLCLLELEYDGHPRVVAPYVHGWTRNGDEVLRAIQVGGTSRSGGFGFGKLWRVDKMRNLRNTLTAFVPDDPNYNPDDSMIAKIHCRLEK
jgi:hypothetical protein